MTNPTPAHTPEPWTVVDRFGIQGADLSRVDHLQLRNADRIVACVNTCAGMIDPATEIAALREKAAKWDDLQNVELTVETKEHLDRMKQIRDTVAADALDAKRYRKLLLHLSSNEWLQAPRGNWIHFGHLQPSDFDDAVDAIGGGE